MVRSASVLLLAGLLLLLPACGGGGGGGGGASGGVASTSVFTGIISGKGSIIVDGVEWKAPTAGGAITVDGSPATEADLTLGSSVRVKGTVVDATHGNATAIDARPALRGQVDAVSGNDLSILGQTATLTPSTIRMNFLGSLSPGDFAEIHGVGTGAGRIRATLVRKVDGTASSELEGAVASLDTTAKTFSIGGQSVTYGGATLVPASAVLANGDFVEVTGATTNGVFQATRVEVVDVPGEAGGHQAAVRGFVGSSPDANRQFTVDGGDGAIPVRLTDATAFQNGAAGDVVAGAPVEILGIFSNGVLDASNVRFDLPTEIEDPIHIVANVDSMDAGTSTMDLLGIPAMFGTGSTIEDETSGGGLDFNSIGLHNCMDIIGSLDSGGRLDVANAVRRANDQQPFVVQGPVQSHDATAGTIRVMGVQMVLEPFTRFKNAAGNGSDKQTFLSTVVDGVTNVRVTANGTLSPGTLPAETLDVVPVP
jgi:hypothetical protein